LIFLTERANQLSTHWKQTSGAFSFSTSGDIFTQPTLNVVQKCEVGSGRRRKNIWAAEEAVE